MKIVVLVKQVPHLASLHFDPVTRSLKREGVGLEVSSFDLRAVARAVEMKAEHGAEIVALTMGPPQARDALVHCLALGADRGVHLVDRAFAGADTLATARALAEALAREGFDLVLCGRASTDAETGQVGPEVAELLDLPQVTCAHRLTLDADGWAVRVERETELGFETLDCPLPALVSAGEDLAPERFPRRADRLAAKEKPIAEVTAADLGGDAGRFGAAGSPTMVDRIEAVEVARECRWIEGTPSVAAATLADLLLDGVRAPREGASKAPAAAPRVSVPYWVVAESLEGRTRRVSLELLGRATELCDDVAAVSIGAGVGADAATLARHGARRVWLADDARLADYSTERHAAVLSRAIERHRPAAVLFPATYFGQDLAPRVAARLGLGLTGDCIDLSLDAAGDLLQWKPAFGGNVVAPIRSRTRPVMATVRPGVFAPKEGPDADPVIESLDLGALPEPRARVVARRRAPGAERAAALDEAEIAIGVGMGVGADGLAVVEELATLLGAGIATTRDVTDAGWLPKQHQVGMTGRAVGPRVYLALGIRGAFEHTVGIRRAGRILSINRDPKAPIFSQSDAGVVGDWRETVAALIDEIRRRGAPSRARTAEATPIRAAIDRRS